MIRDLPQRAVIFPWFITAVMFISALTYSVRNLLDRSRWDASFDPQYAEDIDVGPYFVTAYKGPLLAAFGVFFTLSLMMILLGAHIALPLFTAAYLLFKGESLVLSLGAAIIFGLLIYFGIGRFMQIDLPDGILLSFIS